MRLVIKHSEGDTTKGVIINIPNWEEHFDDFLDRLSRAVSYWMDKTADGGRVKVENHDTFRLYELVGYVPDCFLRNCSLGQAMSKFGVPYFNIEVIASDFQTEKYRADMNLYVKKGGK